jgi:hypothetical protein
MSQPFRQPRDQIIGCRQRADAPIRGIPDLRMIGQHLQHRMDGWGLVLQPVLQFDDQLAVFLLPIRRFEIPLLGCNRG